MKPLVFKKSRRARRTEREPVRHKLHVAKGDRVRVIRGDDRGCEGKVLHVYPKQFWVVIEGVNVVKKHKRATTPQGESGIIEFPAPIAASKVMLLDPKSGQPTRVRRRTRVGWPDFGSSSITFDAAIGAGNSMIPLSPWGVVARLCFFTTFTPSITTQNCLGYTCRTLPSHPRSSPRITRTRSPLATWSLWRAGSRSVRRARRLFLKTSGFISDHLRRERHD